MDGRTVVVTGASAGIGAAAARRLAEAGATVVPVGRSPEKTARVAAEIGVEGLTADFARLADVRRVAEEVRARCPDGIDALANNAGGYFPKRVVTEDGHELTFQVNHLAPFLLTVLLGDLLGGGRVVTTSSVANRIGRVRLENLDGTRGRYSATRAYGTSKLLNVLFTRELARRWREDDVVASCFHPGPVASDFGRDSFAAGLVYRTPLKHLVAISPDSGAAPLVSLVTREDRDETNGRYFERFRPSSTNRQAGDADLARAVWERSAQMAGVAVQGVGARGSSTTFSPAASEDSARPVRS